PGVGEKTAAKWLTRYGSLAGLAEHAAEIKGKAGQNLRDNLESVLLNRELTELVRDVELGCDPADLKREPYDGQALLGLLDALEFRNPNLRERLFAVDPGAEAQREQLREAAVVTGEVLRPGALAPWLAAHDAAPLGL